jgi:hypothetical protein
MTTQALGFASESRRCANLYSGVRFPWCNQIPRRQPVGRAVTTASPAMAASPRFSLLHERPKTPAVDHQVHRLRGPRKMSAAVLVGGCTG